MKYDIILTSAFKKSLKKIKKRNLKLDKLTIVVNILASGSLLEPQYKDHQLINSKKFGICRECHIEPDWLLIYRINNEQLILLLIETGTHSDLF